MSDVFQSEKLDRETHADPDMHWIGESIAPPTEDEIAALVGPTSDVGTSKFVARSDHKHQIDPGLLTEFAEFNPAGNTDAEVLGVSTLWLSAPISGEVPDWATRAIVQINITGIYATAAGSNYVLDATLSGGTVGGQFEQINHPNANERQNISFCINDSSGFSTGAGQFIRIFAKLIAGAGPMRADANSRVSCLITFRP